jgi:hypothetical protein
MDPTIALTLPLISFLFVCLIFPKIVRNRPQFYISFALLVFILLFNILAAIFRAEGFVRFLGIMSQIFLLGAFILLVLCAGGLSLHELSGEVFRSFEVMRRGDTTKTTIIPLTGQQPKAKDTDSSRPRHEVDEDIRQQVIKEELADTAPPPPQPPDATSSIPLDDEKNEPTQNT